MQDDAITERRTPNDVAKTGKVNRRGQRGAGGFFCCVVFFRNQQANNDGSLIFFAAAR